MKYLKYKRSLIVIATALTVFAGCKKGFLDINDNPNDPTDENITPELIFVAGAEGVGARMGSTNFRFLNSWVGYLSAAGDFAIVQDETTYNVDFTFSNAIWGNHYNVLFDLYQAKTKALAGGDTVLAGASMVLSAKLWQELVDIYGNIPYSQAFKGSSNATPAYDNAQDIYEDLLLKLDTAKMYLSREANLNFNKFVGAVVKIGNETLGGEDGDDPAKRANWIKFANTLKLRLLIRQSEVPGFNPASELAKMYDGGSSLNILRQGETVSANPGYANEENKQSPFYATYGYTPTDADANTSTRANQYIVAKLNQNGDPRVSRFFAPVGGVVVGTTFGSTSNPGGALTSKQGPGLLGDTHTEGAEQDQWIFPSFISLFLEAEAIARGWVTGDPEIAYENALLDAFTWIGVDDPAASVADYLTNPDVNWSSVATGSVTAKVKFLAYQKYLSMTSIDPIEAWSDIRRLDMMPDNGYISVNPGKVSNTLPVRLPYPQTEYTANGANVNAQGAINIFSSKIFWDQP